MNSFFIILGQLLSKSIQILNLGNGSTWPGHIALSINKHFIQQIIDKNDLQIVLVAGTNGKTTTSLMIKTVLEKNGKKVIQNQSGANLLNGIASTLIMHANISGKIHADFAIFEIDENSLASVLKEVRPSHLLILNLFRDQLDRYGEVHTIADKWKLPLQNLPKDSLLYLNADDPEVSYLGQEVPTRTLYLGLDDSKLHQTTREHAADSTNCPRCGAELFYKKRFFSHLGDWVCSSCHLKRPELALSSYPDYPMTGTYNRYNTIAAVLILRNIGITDSDIAHGLEDFIPAFGRQEVIDVENKQVQIFLSKNPTGFNESLRTIHELGAKHVILALNDNAADGTDVSWIWDTDMEILNESAHVIATGMRAFDMGLRLKYSRRANYEVANTIQNAIDIGLSRCLPHETLFILPTYTAMLEVRNILTGRKIL